MKTAEETFIIEYAVTYQVTVNGIILDTWKKQ